MENNMNKKYELTNETIQVNNKTLYRIKALRDFGNVGKGDLGGWIEKETNLSQEGDCWVYDNARVYGNAIVYDNARVYDSAMVYDNARVYDNAIVYGYAIVYGNMNILGKLISKVDDFIEIQNPNGRIVTSVLKGEKIFYNIGCQDEITKDKFIDRIYNEGGGIETNPHRKNYLKIIEMSEIYFKKQN